MSIEGTLQGILQGTIACISRKIMLAPIILRNARFYGQVATHRRFVKVFLPNDHRLT